eukprot:Awhi_evm1s15574
MPGHDKKGPEAFGWVDDEVTCRHISLKGKKEFTTAPEGVNTLHSMFKASAEKYPDNKCFGTRPVLLKEVVRDETLKRDFEKVTLGNYEWQTYKQCFTRAVNFGKGLLEDGVNGGDKVAIFMDTCADWQISAHGCHSTNVSVVTFYATLGEEAVAYGLNQTKVTHLVTEERLLPMLKKILPECPDLKHIIFTGKSDVSFDDTSVKCTHLSEIEALGEKSEKELVVATPEDLAVIMYTSGSTGLPKGVMLTNLNVTSCVNGIRNCIGKDFFRPDDRYIGYLPLAHILEMVAENTLISCGGAIGFGSPTTLSDTGVRIKAGSRGDAPALKPTLMAAVPAIMDRIRKGVFDKMTNSPWVIRTLFNHAYHAKSAALKHGGDTPFWNALVLNKIKAFLGGELRIMLSGGAPLSSDTQEFMNIAFGIPVAQGYGLTECSGAATICHPHDRTYGRVGAPLPSIELKLSDWVEGGYLASDKDKDDIKMPRGEILMAGSHIAQGYFGLDEKTAEDFVADENGKVWFHTGDIGQIHDDGCIQIIDRKKDLVKLAMGEYVSLGKVEAVLKGVGLIENVCVYANSLERYAIAVVCPNVVEAKKIAASNNISFETMKDIYTNEAFYKAMMKAIADEGKKMKLQRFEIPTKVHITDVEWTADNDLVTSALKLKRNNINKHYEEELKALYASK